MPTTTLPQFALGGLSDGYLSASALLLERDGKLSLQDPLVPGSSVTVRQYLAGTRETANGRALLAKLISDRSGTPFRRFVTQRIFTPIGAHRTVVADDGGFQSDVDDLYRWALGLQDVPGFTAAGEDHAFEVTAGPATGSALGWDVDRYRGVERVSEYGSADRGRNALVQFPERHAVTIIVSNSDALPAGALADRIADRLFARP